MEALQKTVVLGSLIYFIYGILNLIQIGVYLPPFPLRSFILLAILIVFVKTQQRTQDRLLWVVFSVWLSSYLFVSPLFLENFLSFAFLSYYVNQIMDIVIICNAILFFLTIVFMLRKVMLNKGFLIFLSIVFLAVIVFSLLLFSSLILGVIGFAVFLYLIIFKREVGDVQKTEERIALIIYGLGFMLIIDNITLLIYR